MLALFIFSILIVHINGYFPFRIKQIFIFLDIDSQALKIYKRCQRSCEGYMSTQILNIGHIHIISVKFYASMTNSY